MACSLKKIMSYKKSMISVIVAILLIGSAVTLTLSTFQKARAQNSSAAQKKAQEGFGFGRNNGQQQETTASNPAQTKAQQAFNQETRLTANQGQQQPQQLEPEENVGNKVSDLQNKITGAVEQLVELERIPRPGGNVPIATSGNNVYLVWPSNKTTADFEIMFKASTDNGKTFSPKINLSNSTGVDSERPEIAASGNNVYVSWWERNQTSNEPVLRVSNDNGKTFGDKIMLSAKQ
jgi:hypothetical protein